MTACEFGTCRRIATAHVVEPRSGVITHLCQEHVALWHQLRRLIFERRAPVHLS